MNLLEWSAPIGAAVALATLMILETWFPLLHRKRDPRRAARHLALAGLNAGVAVLFSGATLGVITLAESRGFGALRWFHLERLEPWLGPTVCGLLWAGVALVLLDAWHWAFHVLAHKAPWLWRFHAVHHTDEHVDATTAMRFHFGEVAVQCALSLPVYAVLGVSMWHVLLYHVILLPVAMFNHANLRIPERVDRVIRWFVVTPRMHLVHHSKWTPETDSNYAAVLSIWDRLLGTYVHARDPRHIDLGLDGFDEDHVTRLHGMLAQPLSDAKSEYGRAPQ